MAQYLVTGGSGFIGSHICEGLISAGHSVRVLDNLSSGRRENLKQLEGDIDFVEGDILDSQTLSRAMKGVEFVLHQAAIASVQVSIEQPLIEQRTNSFGTLSILEAARKADVRRVVFAASASAYGDDPKVPKFETMVPKPVSPYAISKVSGEYYCRYYSMEHGLESVCLRYFNVYGPRQDPASSYSGVISIFVRKMLNDESPIIFGDGLQTRDFVFVNDVVLANILACEVVRAEGQIYNVGSGHSTNMLELVAVLNRILGTEIVPEMTSGRAGDVRESLADVSSARIELGYEPSANLEFGLAQVVEWMRQDKTNR
ncbi:MAG: SDR family oxidoreductase [Candidatus Latescibacterota bacterium]|nr:SDR family oxidoreductase [Candidatus Latescibacterota bacterium]